jgi:hypothetical protein
MLLTTKDAQGIIGIEEVRPATMERAGGRRRAFYRTGRQARAGQAAGEYIRPAQDIKVGSTQPGGSFVSRWL